MKTSVYFVENLEKTPPLPPWPRFSGGWGFTREGLWRERLSLELAHGIVIDDRFLPSPQGLDRALRALSSRDGPLIFDFERPSPTPALSRLVEALEGRETAVPPAWAHLPHRWVLVGPYAPGMSFRRWLETQKGRYGSIVLDGAPLRHRALPGKAPAPWAEVPEKQGFPCPGAFCLHRVSEDGAVVYWDTKETLAARSEAAGVPVLVLASEWIALASHSAAPS